MSRILFAWELGSSYGHLGQLIPLARELQSRGHDVVFAIRELIEGERLLAPHGIKWYQAPLWNGRALNLPDPLNHAELLMHFGFLDPDALLSICRAWRNLIELIAPDLVVFDYAPTAQLACRGMALAKIALATGYFVPPATTPLPAFEWWQKAPMARLIDSERQVVMVANQVLLELDAPLVSRVFDVMSSGNDVFTTLPDLDHFPGRSGVEFVGPIFALGRGAPVEWPTAGAQRIFAYLKADYTGLPRLLDTLEKLDASVLVHVPGVSRRMVERYTSNHMRIVAQPLDMEQARSTCDVAVLHCGLGTVAAMLLAGKPLLLLPQQLEQAMLAHTVVALGVAVTIPATASGQFPRHVKRALADPSLGEAARRFAEKHRGYDQASTVKHLADRCAALLAAS